MVRLKEMRNGNHPALVLCFNSNMVRLKEEPVGFVKDYRECFNSNMVRLKEYLEENEDLYPEVSIPIWFD